MKISYVLPVYNQQNSIASCVMSLLGQTHTDFEIIVIDDASTDKTPVILDAINDKKITRINNIKRMGAAKCRNMGNRQAKGDIIAVCDSDIYYQERGEAIEDFFEHNPECDLFCSALNLRNGDAPPHMIERMDGFNWDFKSKCPISHPTVAYRKRVIEKCQYHTDSIDTDLYEFFLLDCHKAGFKLNGCQDILMCKTENDSNRNKERAWKIKKKKYKEYGIEI